MMAMTSVVFDERTLKTIEELKKIFGVSTNAAVIRKAIALSRVVGQHADQHNNVIIAGKDDAIKLNLTT
jgi:hypothetical protein